MSRTDKDVPNRLRNLGDSCEHCELSTFSVKRSFSAVFFAHELNELEILVNTARDLGCEVSFKEVHGYLGECLAFKPEFLVASSSRIKGHFGKKLIGLFDSERAVYSAPVVAPDNLLWSSMGSFSSTADSSKLLHDFDNSKLKVSSKSNIFTVVTATKEKTYSGGSWCLACADKVLFPYPVKSCRCSGCTHGVKSRNSFNNAAVKLKKAYREGDMDALESLANEFTGNKSDWN